MWISYLLFSFFFGCIFSSFLFFCLDLDATPGASSILIYFFPCISSSSRVTSGLPVINSLNSLYQMFLAWYWLTTRGSYVEPHKLPPGDDHPPLDYWKEISWCLRIPSVYEKMVQETLAWVSYSKLVILLAGSCLNQDRALLGRLVWKILHSAVSMRSYKCALTLNLFKCSWGSPVP